MAKKHEETTQSKIVARDSDNPIIEEYKEDLLSKPSYNIHLATDDEARFCRLEGQLAEMQDRLDDLGERIKALESGKA